MQAKIKNKRILLQAAVIITLLFTVFIIINSVSTFRYFYDLSVLHLKDNSNRAIKFAQLRFHEYKSLSWLLNYWKTNYKSLDVSRKTKDMKKYKTLPPEILADRTSVTSEQAEALTPENQKLFAEFCYMEIVSNLDDLKETRNSNVLYVVELLPGQDAFTFYYKDKDEESYVLGDIFPFNMKAHPVIREMYTTGKNPGDFEIISYMDNGSMKEFFYNYALLKDKNEILGHIVVSFLGSNVRNDIFHEVLRIAGINILCFISLELVLLITINLVVLKPLSEIQKDVKDYTKSKDTDVIVDRLQKIHSRNEIGRLADDLSTLVVELEHYTNENEKLSAEKARIDSELSLAALIQEGAMSKDFPDVKEFKLYALLKPAKEVGGDLYDFFMIDDDHLALVIGDVSGKGISAALFMMKVKTVLKDCALTGNLEPERIIEKANMLLCEGNDAMMFVTVWFGILTISTGEIISVNAGHEYPIVKGSSGKFELHKTHHARPLAIKENAKFPEEKFNLNHGDTFFIYTDGAAEAINESDEQFGLDRIISVLNENPENDPQALSELLLQRLNDFAGNAPQFDDTTILCIKYS